MQDLLIVVDMQNDFIDGSLGTEEAQEIVPRVFNKIEKYWNVNKPIIFTMDTHSANYLNTFEGQHLPVKHCVKGSHGWRISDDFDQFFKAWFNKPIQIQKSTFAYMNWTQLFSDIKDVKGIPINSIEVCGLCTDICVISNVLVLRGLYQNMPIVVDSQCCAGVTPEKHKEALEVMKSCQIEVI